MSTRSDVPQVDPSVQTAAILPIDARRRSRELSRLPTLLTAADVAAALRLTTTAVYAMIERGQLPGVVRIGRRVRIREADLLQWLREKSTPFAGKADSEW
jgi:excisionase family DNA binding protein